MTNPVDVSIQLISKIKREREPVDQTQLDLKGQLHEKDGSYYLTYKETHSEIGESTHILKIGSDRALIMRKGPVSMRLPLILGEETAGDYTSPAGPFLMRAKTDRCDIDWEGGNGRIQIAYRLHLQNEYVGKFALEFKLQAI